MRDNFSTAIVRLTTLYVLVLTAVCFIFSGLIYTLATNEIDRTSRRQVVGFRNMLGRFIIDEDESEKLRTSEASESRSRLRANLFLGNLAVIGAGTVLSYFFAKRTLKPIEEGVKAQERFTSDASHELRTPLASMRTEIEVALRDPALKLKDAKELLLSNLEEVMSMHTMTDNLLTLARSKTLSDITQVDLKRLVESSAKKHSKAIKANKSKLQIKAKQVSVCVNKASITQVIGILIDNAVKYSGEGSTIMLDVYKEENCGVIRVSDNGPGIDATKIATVFDRFSRIDDSRTSQKVGGHGLGLSIAKLLVEVSGGEITVESTPGQNTSFFVYLPTGVKS